MTDDEFWSATDQLKTIHQWARARFAAPRAVLGAVLLRVAATTGPHVQLPAVIGGRASLNMMAVFVAPSGGGKGVSDAVARLAWPVADIHEEGLGSGQGIAELFKQTKNPEDRIDRAIFSVSEIDHLTSLHEGKANNTRATLKAALMGERIGSKGASLATSRVVPQHSYRMCLSVGGQPGHCGVILDDASGGMPQRVLWLPGVDPDMPDDPAAEPEPLNHNLPGLLTRRHDDSSIVTEIVYGTDEIAAAMIAARLAHSRGEGDPLDGHKALTRAKVASVLAVMDHRTVVTSLDWELAGHVMDISSRTRDWVIEHAKQAARAKVRDRAIARAAGEDFYDASRLETVKRSLLRMLERDGEQAGNVLRMRLGRKEKRELFDQAIGLLQEAGLVEPAPGLQKGTRYRLSGQGDHGGQGAYSQVNRPDHVGQGDHPSTVTDLDSRRSHDDGRSRPSAPELVAALVAERRAAGETTITSLAVHTAGKAAGHTKASITNAMTKNPDMVRIDRDGGTSIYSIDGTGAPCQSFSEWTRDYILTLPANTELVDKEAFARAAEEAGHSAESASRTVLGTGLVTSETDPDNGRETLWRINRDVEETPA
jgi:hypothetical protein